MCCKLPHAWVEGGLYHFPRSPNSGRSCTPGGSSFPIMKGSWAKWSLWGSPSSRDRDPDPRMTRDLEGTLVRFSPSRRSRGSWLTLARILPRAPSAVETADLRHRTRTPHSASGRPCPKTRIHRQRTVILGALACGTTIMETRMPDLGSTEAHRDAGTGMAGSRCALQRSGSRTGSASSRALDSGPPALLDARVRGSGWWLSKTKEAFSCFVR